MFLTWSSVVAAVAILSLIGPSHSTVIPLTNQPVSHGQTSAHSQTLGVSGSSRANTPNQFPAHDPFGRAKIYPGMVPHYPSPDSGQKRQILQLTFQPQGGRLLQNSTQPLPTLKAVYSPTGSGDPSNQDTASILINPANIQWTAPDVPDSVSKEIIEALRAQLGNTPVPLGELNNKMLTFTTSLPSVVINRTMINNVQETVLEENMANKSTRTMLSSYKPVSTTYKVSSSSGYDGHPSKTYVSYDYTTPITSMSYNPAAVYDSSRSAAGPPYSANDYQKSYSEQQYSYQVPTESSYQTNYYQPPPPPPQPQSYTKPQLAYQPDSSHQQQAPPPPAYQKAPESSYSKPPQPQPYQPPKVDYQPPKSEPYQPPKESYAAPLPSQQQYQSPPPPPPPPPPQPSKTSDYQKPKAEPYQPPKEAAYPQQQQKKQQSYAPPKEENVKIIYKYVEVCNPKADSYQPTPPAPQKQPYKQSQPKQSQYPNQSKTSNPYVEVATNLASQYPSSPEPLNLDLASTTTEAAGSAQDSQAILASVYGEIHRRMAELEQLQRYVAQVQNEAQQAAYVPINIPPIYIPPMPTFSYSVPSYPEPPVPNYPEAQVPSTYYSPPVPAPNYPPPPPPKSYAPPPAPAKQPEYRKPPSYTEQKSPSYSAPKPPSYTAQPPPQQQSYGSQQPYNGQQMTVQYQKTVEKVSSNSTSAY